MVKTHAKISTNIIYICKIIMIINIKQHINHNCLMLLNEKSTEDELQECASFGGVVHFDDHSASKLICQKYNFLSFLHKMLLFFK